MKRGGRMMARERKFQRLRRLWSKLTPVERVSVIGMHLSRLSKVEEARAWEIIADAVEQAMGVRRGSVPAASEFVLAMMAWRQGSGDTRWEEAVASTASAIGLEVSA